MSKRVYFDNAATTPICQDVIAAMLDVMENNYGNPSSIHAEGRKSRALIEEARKTIATCIGASISEVFFTSGGTESNNMVLKCAVRDLGIKHIISTATEHHCVLHTLAVLQQEGVKITLLPVDELGHIRLSDLEAALVQSNQKTLVSLMHANNEIGTMIDMAAIGAICQQYNALFHSDSVQTIGHFAIDVSTIPIHFLSGAAHKFHGPKGVGFVYIRQGASIKPFIDGGAQERNMRGGTENLYGIVGMAKALQLATDQMEERVQKIVTVRNYMMEKLDTYFEDISFNGDITGHSLYTVLSVSFPPSPKGNLLLLNLDIHGISASGGSACSSGAEGSSHVIQAIGGDPDRKTIRFSFSHYNSIADVDYCIERLRLILPTRVIV
ncbi:MAG: cysteine desulfurase [Saprospiraceae bacterium]|nr:cysteine desulfurase [Saprospiraceae bacterium]MBP7679745.1 cysteine desulfurase [Saprospiraceae bacterium]